MARVNVGKRIFTDPNGIFKTISVFSEVEPAPEVNQIREFRPNLAEILAQAAAEQQAAEQQAAEPVTPLTEHRDVSMAPVIGLIEQLAPEPPVAAPAKPKRPYKPRPYKPRPKKKL